MPGTKTAAGGIAHQPPLHSQCNQRRTATTWCLPLPPQSGPESQPDPTSEGDEHFGCFAEAEIADPTPHIRGKLFHCRLDADTLGPARDLSGSSLEPFQGLWRDDALDVWTGRKAVSRSRTFTPTSRRTVRDTLASHSSHQANVPVIPSRQCTKSFAFSRVSL